MMDHRPACPACIWILPLLNLCFRPSILCVDNHRVSAAAIKPACGSITQCNHQRQVGSMGPLRTCRARRMWYRSQRQTVSLRRPQVPHHDLAIPPTVDQKSSAQPFGGDPHSMSSHGPPALTSASSVVTSSSESNSYGPTIFTDPMSQSNPRSFMSSADVPRYPLSQSASNAPPSTTSEPVRPMVSTETPNQELRTPRTNKPYELDELDAIIRFFLGKDVPAGRLEVAMKTWKPPRLEHILESEWFEASLSHSLFSCINCAF